MAEGYDVKSFPVGRIIVVLHPGCTIKRENILDLLRETGIDEDAVTFVQPDELNSCGQLEDVPILFPLDGATFDTTELDKAARRGSEAGGKVVVVFDSALQYDGLHPIADKYGTQTDWSADHLRPCLVEDLPPTPREARGEAVDRSTARPVKCGR